MTTFKINKILVPVDFSPASLHALDYAHSLAKLTNAEITLLHIVENIHSTTDPFFVINPGVETLEGELRKASNESLARVAEQIKEKGDIKLNFFSSTGRTHKEILRVREKINADIIVMGTHGVSGFREFISGSNAFRVISDSLCPVLSIPEQSDAIVFKNIFVPFSDRPHSREKVMYAISMAQIYGAVLSVLGIDEENTKEHADRINKEAEQIKKIAEKYRVKCSATLVAADYNAKTVLTGAKNAGSDLITVMGDIMKKDIADFFTGSFSEQIVNHSPIPVLSVHSIYNPETVSLWQGM
ncbi:MAG: universal stress protein [Bacteroidia bacterium]